MASTVKRDQRIVSGLRSGETYREVAEKVGVHHRTAQRVAKKQGAYSARSPRAIEEDFNTKGRKVFRAAQAKALGIKA